MNLLFQLRLLLLSTLITIWALAGRAQSGYTWQLQTSSPTTQSVKFDDIHFLNTQVGMTCNGDGKVYRTTDGGSNWAQVLSNPQAFFRSIVLVDSLRAFVGNFGYYAGSSILDSNAVYQTTDGGQNWTPAPIPAPTRIGICGLHKVGATHLYGVGRIEGPASFIKSSDAGSTWSFTDMAPYCGFLVDCHFQSVDTGFVIGGTNDSMAASVPLILRTFDGGNSWDTVQIGPQNPQSWCWKIHFPSRQTGYVTIESNNGPVQCLKTTDAGDSWVVKPITNTHFNLQGIGFVRDSVGWAGGYYGTNLYETTDGGDTWTSIGIATNLNRIHRLDDTLLWASGKRLYKVTPTPITAVTPNPANNPIDWVLRKCSSSKCVWVELLDPLADQHYDLFMYDVAGREIKKLSIQGQSKTQLDLGEIPYSLIYFVIANGERHGSKLYVND